MGALVWEQEAGPVLWRAGRDFTIADCSSVNPAAPFRASWRPVLGRAWHLGDHADVESAKVACQVQADRVARQDANAAVMPGFVAPGSAALAAQGARKR